MNSIYSSSTTSFYQHLNILSSEKNKKKEIDPPKREDTLANKATLHQPYVYLDPNDYFHQEISHFMKDFLLSNHLFLTKKEFQDRYFNDHTKFSLFPIILSLLNFKEEFLDLFEKKEYQKDLNYLQKIIEKKELAFPFITFDDSVSQDYECLRPINAYLGDKLVIGCGKEIAKLNFCDCANKDIYFINKEKSSKADIIGDYYSNKFWEKELPNSRFQEVFFEGFDPFPKKSSLKQIVRILKKEGLMKINFSQIFQEVVKQKNWERLEQYFQECGFKSIQLINVPFKSCGFTTKHQMLYVYK